MIIKSAFQPHPWLKNPHFQTIVASKFRQCNAIQLNNERLNLPDGDFVDVALHTANSGPIVFIFHGLQGSLNSTYASGIIPVLLAANFNIAFMHFRGCSGEPNRLAKSYHSGHTEDIRFFINTIKARYPNKQLQAIAYSLGANALLKYLGEEGVTCPLSGAIAVSPPLVLSEGAKRLNRGVSRLYQLWLVREMQSAVLKKQLHYPELALPENPRQYKNFISFDHNITAVVNGFKSGNDYYLRSSARQFLSAIQTSTHIIFAKDDPFFTDRCIPTNEELSSSVCFELSEHGGHVGFIDRDKEGKQAYWLERRIPELLNSFHNTDMTRSIHNKRTST